MQVQDTKINPPASDVATKLAKVSAPPIQQQPKKQQRPENQRAQSCYVGAPSLDADKKNNGAITQDDIDVHNGHYESCDLFISKATRRILDSVDASQVESAQKGVARVKLMRKQSGIKTEDLGKYSRELNGRGLVKQASDDDNENDSGYLRFSISMETLGEQFISFVGFDEKDSDDLSDDDSDESDDKEVGDDRERRCKSMGDVDRPRFKQSVEDYAAREEGDATETSKVKCGAFLEQKQTIARVSRRGRRCSMQQSSEPTVRHPHPRRRTVESRISLVPQRRSTLSKDQQSGWKPLSSDQHDVKNDEEEYKGEPNNEKSEDAMDEKAKGRGKKGIGMKLWNHLTSNFNSSFTQETTNAERPKKQRSASSYFRRGKKKAEKCQFLQAVALYNFALIRQREELGENHIDCGTTLNEIGVCWMMLGERYPALTALEEALYIRKKKLGDGAKEIAETTANILMVFEEEREDMECMVQEDDG